jgi:hypothetical protein
MRKTNKKFMKKSTKTEYLIIGSNNFWYSTEASLKNAITTVKEIKKEHSGFGDPETEHEPSMPETFYIYKAEEIKQL